jgi:hypothetical protein
VRRFEYELKFRSSADATKASRFFTQWPSDCEIATLCCFDLKVVIFAWQVPRPMYMWRKLLYSTISKVWLMIYIKRKKTDIHQMASFWQLHSCVKPLESVIKINEWDYIKIAFLSIRQGRKLPLESAQAHKEWAAPRFIIIQTHAWVSEWVSEAAMTRRRSNHAHYSNAPLHLHCAIIAAALLSLLRAEGRASREGPRCSGKSCCSAHDAVTSAQRAPLALG